MSHSLFSPSSISSLLSCQTQLFVQENLGGDEDNAYTTEGTVAHNVIERAAKQGVCPHTLVGTKDEGTLVTTEMANDAKLFLDEVARIVKANPGAQVFHEVRLVHSIISEFGGTMDCLIVTEDDIFVLDFKFGAGISVEVENNKQLLSYAVLAMDEHGRRNIHLTVIQPRRPHHDGPVRHWSPTWWDIEGFVDELLEGVLWYRSTKKQMESGLVTLGDLTSRLVPSTDNCRFCSRNANCPAQQANITLVHDKRDSDMDEDHLAFVLGNDLLLRKHIEAVKAQAHAHMTAGGKIAGYKLVTAYGNRKFTCKTAVLQRALELSGYSPSLATKPNGDKKTPSQLEKDVPRFVFEDLIETPVTGTKVVPESAYGADLNDDASSAFEAAGA